MNKEYVSPFVDRVEGQILNFHLVADTELKEIYTSQSERAAYRAALSAATMICDTLAVSRMSPKQCADVIWQLRARVTVPVS